MNNQIEMPIFKRADHVSLTVADIDATIEFYTTVMGATLEYRMGPFDAAEMPLQDDGRDWSEAHVNVKGARQELAMLKIADNLNMELFQFYKPEDGNKTPPRNNDIGARHLCLEVGDVHATVEYLVQHGCQSMAGPITMDGDAPCPPSHSWYVIDPFGHQLELVEYL